jgi:uncharacterized OB-fold protein
VSEPAVSVGIERNVPEPSEVSRPFWDATRRGELVVQWCSACAAGIFYPRILCPRCGSLELSWRTADGFGTVYSHATHYVPGSQVRYCVALIDLDEGVRMVSNVIGLDPDEVAVGQRVQVAWEPLPDGRALPVFRSTLPDKTQTMNQGD